MARIVRARYENDVLKPLEKLDLREGEEVIAFIRRKRVRDVLKKYVGILGESSVEELRELEEEAQVQ